MSTSHPDADADAVARFEVRVLRDGDLVQTVHFADLAEAETFMEEWSEMRPRDQLVIEDSSRDHSAWELVEDDTALIEDFARAAEDVDQFMDEDEEAHDWTLEP